MNGKGDRNRSCTKAYREGWNRIFGKKVCEPYRTLEELLADARWIKKELQYVKAHPPKKMYCQGMKPSVWHLQWLADKGRLARCRRLVAMEILQAAEREGWDRTFRKKVPKQKETSK